MNIYINNRDRWTTTRQLVDDLMRVPEANPIIVDNASTFPPLLKWYESDPCPIIRLEKNLGPRAPWSCMKNGADKYYAVTDSDLSIAGIPSDFLYVLIHGLEKYPWAAKAGLSLEIYDLPDAYPYKQMVIGRESKFWTHRIDELFWQADIDTTFAVYRSDPPWDGAYGPSLRSHRPYTAKHAPWYVIPGKETEEELHYLRNLCPSGIFWSNLAQQDLLNVG